MTQVTIQCPFFTQAEEVDVFARLAVASSILILISACSDVPNEVDADFLKAQPAPVREVVQEAIALAEERPRDATAWGHYGRVLHANQLLPQAIPAYQKASTLNPEEPEWSASLAVVLLGESMLEEAAVAVSAAISAEIRENPQLLFLAGSIREELGLYDEALSAYESVLSNLPSSFEAQFAIGRVLLNLGRYEEALPYLQTAMADAPRSGEIRNALVRLTAAAPDLDVVVPSEEEAGDLRRVALPLPYEDRLRPYVRTLDGLRSFSASLLEMNATAKAEEMLSLIKRHYPQQMQAQEWMDLAHLQASRGDIMAAESSYRGCIETHPDFANGFLGLADLLFMKNDLSGARDNYRQADSLASTERQRARVLQGYGRLAARAGSLDESLRHMRLAANAWPESGVIQEDLARILADLGRVEEAWTHVRRAEGLGHQVSVQFKRQLQLVSSR